MNYLFCWTSRINLSGHWKLDDFDIQWIWESWWSSKQTETGRRSVNDDKEVKKSTKSLCDGGKSLWDIVMWEQDTLTRRYHRECVKHDCDKTRLQIVTIIKRVWFLIDPGPKSDLIIIMVQMWFSWNTNRDFKIYTFGRVLASGSFYLSVSLSVFLSSLISAHPDVEIWIHEQTAFEAHLILGLRGEDGWNGLSSIHHFQRHDCVLEQAERTAWRSA